MLKLFLFPCLDNLWISTYVFVFVILFFVCVCYPWIWKRTRDMNVSLFDKNRSPDRFILGFMWVELIFCVISANLSLSYFFFLCIWHDWSGLLNLLDMCFLLFLSFFALYNSKMGFFLSWRVALLCEMTRGRYYISLYCLI